MTEETVAMATVCHRLLPYPTAVISQCPGHHHGIQGTDRSMLPLPHTPLPSRIADPWWGESEESEWGRTASESAQVSAYVHICLQNLPLSACFLVTLLLLSPQEARDFESKKWRLWDCHDAGTDLFPAGRLLRQDGAHHLNMCCDDHDTSGIDALRLYDAQDTGVLHHVFSVINVLQVLVMSLVMLPSASPSGASLFLPSFCRQVFVYFVITCHNHYPVFVAAGRDSDGFPHVSPTSTGCSNWAFSLWWFLLRTEEAWNHIWDLGLWQVDWLRFTWRSNTRNQLPLVKIYSPIGSRKCICKWPTVIWTTRFHNDLGLYWTLLWSLWSDLSILHVVGEL